MEEVMDAWCIIDIIGRVHDGTRRKVVGKSFHDDEEVSRSSNGGNDCQTAAAALFPADDEFPYGVKDDSVEKKPASFLDVNGTCHKSGNQEEETTVSAEARCFFPFTHEKRAHGGKNNSRNDGNVSVGHILCRHKGVEKDCADHPDHEKTVERGLFFPLPDGFINCHAGPGKESGREDDKVVVPVIVFRMLGNRSSCYVVQAEELGNEVASMNGIHAAVPGKDDDKESKDARDGEEGKNLLRLFHGKAPENKKDAWKDKPDRAFSEAGKASSGISNDQMLPASFHDADVSGKKGRNRKEKKDAVRDDGMGDDPEFKGKRQHEPCPDGCNIILQDSSYVPGKKRDGKRPAKGRGEPCREIGEAQDGIADGKQPVNHDRLVIPVNAINLRGHPVA